MTYPCLIHTANFSFNTRSRDLSAMNETVTCYDTISIVFFVFHAEFVTSMSLQFIVFSETALV